MAARKVEGLLTAQAKVRVISPISVPEIESLADAGAVEILRRSYRYGDLAGVFLAIAATDDPQINHAVWREATERGCLINVVDDPQHSNFILPAVVQRGEMSIAISTGGSSPALARRLRERMETLIGPEYGVLTELLGSLRPEIMAHFSAGQARLLAALRIIDSDILEIIRDHGKDAALTYARELLYQQH
ncbi:MAG: bifunctional precorrin-2 dehydrogenase/sirohydrochlorin ferrochelatase [Anaerolineales bacterium]